MLWYISQRILAALVTLWAILTIAFICLYLLPGDPARIILGPQASAESINQFRHDAGLDLPIGQQYARYVVRTSKLDLGYSFALRRPVRDLIVQRGIASLKLVGIATLFVLIGGILLPLLLKTMTANRTLSAYAQIAQTAAFFPSYVLATLSLIIFSGWLGWLPILFDPNNAQSWALGAAVLSAYPIALLLRIFLAQLNAELASTYARRARALGFSRAHTLWREALPNALPAALAVLANSVAFFATSAFFAEVVFGIPGLGRLAQEALRQKDIAVLGGVCLTFAVFVLSLSLLLSVAQRFLSPKKRLSHVE